ncbi:MAG: iron chelate uptake ABC transporter family permease subunit [Chloroherpetonaceae bacterium]|nr:metal ABC transporter permease [Chthonomonadaceae bacterium]MDW8209368.1 iron chelate uptake ABC transporter family permease subunit [Chloroherpetonaceae bacterium]
MELVRDLLADYTLRNVMLGAVILGCVSGVLGCFAILRRQGLMGDALSHAALPGVCLAYLLTGQKAPVVLMAGAAVACWVAMWLVLLLLRRTRIDSGAALGTVLTIFFGAGVVLLTLLQKRNDANQAGLDRYLFGQAAALVQEQVVTMAVLGGSALLVVLLLYKEFQLIAFDPEFARTLGLPARFLETLLTGLLVVAIVIGLNTVGIVLMSALLVGPAVTARQWTHSLGRMIGYAGVFGALAGVFGALVSVRETRMPTGPVIILCIAVMVILSVLFGAAQGVVWERVRRRRHAPEPPPATGEPCPVPPATGGRP